MSFSKHANIRISIVMVNHYIPFFRVFLLTIIPAFFVNKYAMQNFDFIKIFSSISNFHM